MTALPRFATPRTGARSTLGGEVAAIAAELGKPLLAFQRDYCDVALELDDDGHLVWRTCALSLPRQSGKSWLMSCVLLHRCLIWGERQHVVYSCQTALAAGKRIEEIERLVRESSLADQVERVSRAIGDQSITFVNGSVLSIVAGTEGSGHGETFGLAVLDECWEQRAERRDLALRPATIAVPDLQVWLCSTAGDGREHLLASLCRGWPPGRLPGDHERPGLCGVERRGGRTAHRRDAGAVYAGVGDAGRCARRPRRPGRHGSPPLEARVPQRRAGRRRGAGDQRRALGKPAGAQCLSHSPCSAPSSTSASTCMSSSTVGCAPPSWA